jgi:16S rRNA processing protein RimM
MSKKPEPDFLAIGRILRPHGVHGELRVKLLTDFPDRWTDLKTVYLGPRHLQKEIQSTRQHKNMMLVKLVGYENRDAVESLRGELLYVTIKDAMPLEPDEFYLFQVMGLEVQTESGDVLGEIVDVLKPPGANEVFVIHGIRGEILIPVIDEVIVSLDLEAGVVVINPIPGLLRED